ncbi:MAG: hypothetical protein Q8M06_11925 [Methanobacteriaceae archaeon]|nr:hypothetical protein [Methanobacteriaceae archaeon]
MRSGIQIPPQAFKNLFFTSIHWWPSLEDKLKNYWMTKKKTLFINIIIAIAIKSAPNGPPYLFLIYFFYLSQVVALCHMFHNCIFGGVII